MPPFLFILKVLTNLISTREKNPEDEETKCQMHFSQIQNLCCFPYRRHDKFKAFIWKAGLKLKRKDKTGDRIWES